MTTRLNDAPADSTVFGRMLEMVGTGLGVGGCTITLADKGTFRLGVAGSSVGNSSM